MVAEDFPQGGLEQMGCGMVAHRRVPCVAVDRRGHRLTRRGCAFHHTAEMEINVSRRLADRSHLDLQSISLGDRSLITHLSAGLGIKRGLLQNDFEQVTLRSGLNQFAIP